LIILEYQEFLENLKLFQRKVEVIELGIVAKKFFENHRLKFMRNALAYLVYRYSKKSIIALFNKPRIELRLDRFILL